MGASLYQQCCSYKGRYVNIQHKNGQSYYGRIVDVDDKHVYVDMGRNGGGRGFGYNGGYGYYGGYGSNVVPFAFGAIAGLALAGAFFFW
ncbi:hypothetical protein MKX54_06965 [Alkalihalobacillus sp. FSL R5-0424]